MNTTYLGQFDDAKANIIAGLLEEAGIAWSYKQAGWITKVFFMGEWGTRLFVEADRLAEAQDIVESIPDA